MRFVFSICALVTLFLAVLMCAPLCLAQDINLGEPTARNFTPRLQKGKQVNRLKTADGLSFEIVQNGLGTISALASNGTGLIYSADPDTGRIWILSDRSDDGRIDIKRALPHRFDRPTGLAAIDKTLYVADRAAIWIIKGENPPQKLAGLKNAQSTEAFHPLSLSPEGTRLYLGLTTKDNIAKIFLIDQTSGEASLLDSQPATPQLRHLSVLDEGMPWILTERGTGANLSQMTEMENDYRLLGMALPQSQETWPSEYSRDVIIAQQSSTGFSVLGLPASLGRVETKGRVLFSGFLSDTGRTAWGSPGALLFEKHGLLVADSFNGDIYRLKATGIDAAIPVQTSPSTDKEDISSPASDSIPSMVVSTITGSQIDKVSGIDSASSLDTGSTIIRDYKPLEIEKSDDEGSLENNSPN